MLTGQEAFLEFLYSLDIVHTARIYTINICIPSPLATFSEVNLEHHSENLAYETPDLWFRTMRGYAIVRADERGSG